MIRWRKSSNFGGGRPTYRADVYKEGMTYLIEPIYGDTGWLLSVVCTPHDGSHVPPFHKRFATVGAAKGWVTKNFG